MKHPKASKRSAEEEKITNASSYWLATIHVEDFPTINSTTDEGKDQLTALAFETHRRHPTLTHFKFMRDGKEFGELIVAPADQKKWS